MYKQQKEKTKTVTGLVVHTCNAIIQETEAGGLQV
jgi:hypothetical protein